MRWTVVLAILLSAAAPAAASERLTKEELEAAVKAAQARLPPVDTAAAAKCSALPVASAAEMQAAAVCFRAAGSLGRAIQLWHRIAMGPSDDVVRDAVWQLGPAFEAAGDYRQSAERHSDYASRFGAQKDAPERLIRAICTWRQLGDDERAGRGFQQLRRWWKKYSTADPVTLCASVRPIVPPSP